MPRTALLQLIFWLCLVCAANAEQSQQLINLTYKLAAQQTLTLDLYRSRPIPGQKRPVIVYIHGGSWVSGDKSDIRKRYRKPLLQALLAEGYAVASIDYRLASPEGTHLPQQLEDCKDAIRWLRKHADAYGLDTAKMGVWGASAGGHLALMLAYTDDTAFVGAPELRSHSAQVNYVINHFGPSDLVALFRPGVDAIPLLLLKALWPKTYWLRQSRMDALTGPQPDKGKQATLLRFYSPTSYISRESPPTLSVHGQKDHTVPSRQTMTLQNKLAQAGIRHAMLLFPDGDHELKNLNDQEIAGLIRRSLDFIRDSHGAPGSSEP